MKSILISLLFLFCISNTHAQTVQSKSQDSILTHKVNRNSTGKLLSWYKPEIPGAAFSHVMKLASEFLINTCPIDSKTGLPFYLITCCFNKPDLNGDKYVAEDWPHNPACFYAGCVQSLGINYYQFSGDAKYIELVRGMLDYQIQNGTTPEGWVWEKVPYASSDAFEKVYQGGTRWENDGFRGDGLHGIEPDKVGELGYAYIRFFEITGDKKYLEAGLDCANALAKHVRNVLPSKPQFAASVTGKSPWAFRLNARTGYVLSDYCSNALDPFKLFEELLRIKNTIQLDSASERKYTDAKNIAWQWLFSVNGPMKTSIWNGYFEDIPNDALISNRLQITPGELGKYLIQNPSKDANLPIDIQSIIYWIESVFRDKDFDAIKEQTWCYEPMGSHSSRFGSLCALWYEYSGDVTFKEKAFAYLNYASYMCLPDGYVAVGHNWPGAWFSDGYSDYIRHFSDAMAAVPEWAPASEDHLLRCSSVVKNIEYSTSEIRYSTFDNSSRSVFRLASKPKSVSINNKLLSETKIKDSEGWTWQALNNGGIFRITANNSNSIIIKK